MPTTAFFQPDLFQFLRQLKRHNDREWFAKNKERYQQVVVEPAIRLDQRLRHRSTQNVSAVT
jgi:uncharacterized protein (DUF2461 family)